MFDAHRPRSRTTVPDTPAPKPDDQRLGERRAQAAEPARKRGKPNLERAHKTVVGNLEAIPGAPRSGSA